MSIATGQQIELVVEKPASGGRMIARHDGEVVLVSGAIPGERVLALVTRTEKRLAFAESVDVLEPSPYRRVPEADPACGGCVYAHITYERQRQLKAAILEDAFRRIGRIPLGFDVEVTGSPERGYRMRARFHVREGRAGFYREGTHTLCDARATRQLTGEAVDSVEVAVAALAAHGVGADSVELSETVSGVERALHIGIRDRETPLQALEHLVSAAGLTGCTARTTNGGFHSAGDPIVSDPMPVLTQGRASGGTLRRHPEAFFQANRFLIGELVAAVLDSVREGAIVELYAGVGLFSVALAATGRNAITAVEGDPVSGSDLLRNAAPFHEQLRVSRNSVETFMAQHRHGPPQTIIVDPPRTGISKQALDAIAGAQASRILYVSCDAPTMARDARRLLDAGYRLVSLRGFDLFPNTAHVETMGVFDRG